MDYLLSGEDRPFLDGMDVTYGLEAGGHETSYGGRTFWRDRQGLMQHRQGAEPRKVVDAGTESTARFGL